MASSELAKLYGKFRKALEICLETAKELNRIQPALFVEAQVAIITGIIDGMGLQLMTEPDLCRDRDIWQGIETAMMDLLCQDR